MRREEITEDGERDGATLKGRGRLRHKEKHSRRGKGLENIGREVRDRKKRRTGDNGKIRRWKTLTSE